MLSRTAASHSLRLCREATSLRAPRLHRADSFGMTVRPGDRVEVYFNLHKLCLSYRHPGGKVNHADALWLENVTFAVQPAGRERVLREKRKNVHAYIRGRFLQADDELAGPRGGGFVVVRYNPYEHGYFYRADTGDRVDSAREVIAIGKTIYARL